MWLPLSLPLWQFCLPQIYCLWLWGWLLDTSKIVGSFGNIRKVKTSTWLEPEKTLTQKEVSFLSPSISPLIQFFSSILKVKKFTHVYYYLYSLLGYHFSSPSLLDSVAEGERKSVKKKWLIVFQACLDKYRDNFRGKTWWARQFSPCILCVDLQSQWK